MQIIPHTHTHKKKRPKKKIIGGGEFAWWNAKIPRGKSLTLVVNYEKPKLTENMHGGTVEDRREKNEFENKERETKRLTGLMISG